MYLYSDPPSPNPTHLKCKKSHQSALLTAGGWLFSALCLSELFPGLRRRVPACTAQPMRGALVGAGGPRMMPGSPN